MRTPPPIEIALQRTGRPWPHIIVRDGRQPSFWLETISILVSILGLILAWEAF